MVVSLSSTYFDDPRSNPAEGYNFSVLIFVEKGGNKQKEAWIGHFLGNLLLLLDLFPFEFLFCSCTVSVYLSFVSIALMYFKIILNYK